MLGCGQVVQLFHLPNALALEDVTVVGVCDLNEARARLAAEGAGSATWTTDPGELLAMELDAVIVATEDLEHSRLARQTMEAGKHVFVEKPLALSLSDASALQSYAEASNRVLFVGYQRRFDEGVALAREELEARGKATVRLVHLHDLCHDNELVIKDVAPPALLTDGFRSGRTDFTAAAAWHALAQRFGKLPLERAATYRLFLNLACHDVSVLVDVLGEPESVRFADFSTPLFGLVVFEFSNYLAILEVGQTTRKWFDQRLRVVFDDATLELSWPSPFIEDAPTLVEYHTMDGPRECHRAAFASYRSRFRAELDAFFSAVRAGADQTDSAGHAVVVNRWLDAALDLDAAQLS
jgi:myo-inositol 2-dehydrogenase / D-chiro-inositol 1-dehydrogenase